MKNQLRNSQINLADLLESMHTLAPADAEASDGILRLLGLEPRTTEPPPGSGRKLRPARPPATQQPEPPADAPSQSESAEPRPRRRLESVLTPGNSGRAPLPEWIAATEQLGSTETRRLHRAIPLEPLFPARATRAILSGALATPAETGPLNLARVVEMVGRAQTITRMPRFVIPTLSRGVQLLIDQSEAMQPFAADQSVLRSALVQVAGRDRTTVFYFHGSPEWGAGTGLREDWLPWKSPAAGTPVVALTDLGIAQPSCIAGQANASDWKRFAQLLARAHCPLLALVPYPQRRWPAALLRHMDIVQWDRNTTASVIRRVIGSGLKVRKGA
jgi:hypothetical protein